MLIDELTKFNRSQDKRVGDTNNQEFTRRNLTHT